MKKAAATITAITAAAPKRAREFALFFPLLLLEVGLAEPVLELGCSGLLPVDELAGGGAGELPVLLDVVVDAVGQMVSETNECSFRCKCSTPTNTNSHNRISIKQGSFRIPFASAWPCTAALQPIDAAGPGML